MAPLDTRYQAAMLLSGVGDSLGYKNGVWFSCSNGIKIHEELEKLGGVNNLEIKRPEWKVSSYTLLNLHTAIALTTVPYKTVNDSVLMLVAKMYKNTTDDWDMDARHPDETFYAARERLNPGGDQGIIVPFDVNGISSAAAVRGMCIGLRHPGPMDLHNLIKLSIEIGRLLNHNPSGFLGTVATALFTSYALQKKDVKEWGYGLMKTLPKAMSYVKERGIAVQENLTAWNEFEDKWRSYVRLRRIETGEHDPEFPRPYDIKIREEFYKSISGNERPGSNGCDATIIAYDVFLSFDGSWEDLCVRSICHGGLSNVTCSLTACWYGALYGYKGVEKCNYSKVEFWRHLQGLEDHLFNQSDNERLKITKDLAEIENIENPGIAPANDDIRCIYVREGISTNNLIDDQVAKLREDVTSDESMSIGDAIYSHLRNFLDKLGDAYPSCKVSELIKVGSFHKGTKIYFADEFDFIAVLSELSKPGTFVVESSCDDGGRVNIRFNDDCTDLVHVNEHWDNDELQEQQATKITEKVCTRLYNTVMTDRKSIRLISIYDHHDRAEWMALPSVKGVELSVRFSEARSPNMVWEFLYKDRIISVDITLAVRYSNIKELFAPENATVPEVGKAILQRGSVLLVAYRDGFRLTITETEVEYVRKRLAIRHIHLYLYLKYFNYKYGEYASLKRIGCLPFSSYMLKTMCIYHDLRCNKDKEKITNETCLRDIVDIMEESLSEGYQYPAETVNGIVVGFLPSIFNKTKNLYKEPFKSVDRLKALREIMIRDMKTTHFSGRKWQGLSDILSTTAIYE
ncbi:uncharacterized protein LOC123556475 [Mercenaria mercenaria]|uniref:uncharacterized protein LOC123556475 n=1 Tax=Mercenaria mercenaria TaxID=6596 RepID=UPI00234EC5FC|nr:uncharacterized protein LOC123556475 [Mercenaria mercenaria]